MASYTFYGFWDWRFLGLIAFSTLVDYVIGRRLSQSELSSTRRALLWISIAVNLGLLVLFKYYDFFQDTFANLLHLLGFQVNPWSLKILLPVGISFYTFQSMSYTIDVYRREIEPTKDLITFSAFVSFFPQLVAGPIERAKNLIPQFTSVRTVTRDDTIVGVKLCLLGFFKKMAIADPIASQVNHIFKNYSELSSVTLLFGAIFFGIQVYADFSGYSNIARGLSRFLGFRLMVNFDTPYFSRNVGEFWRRWHISLSTWFRDYLYIPLGGSKGSKMLSIRNVFIIFLVSGFWHGANWTFIAWGGYHALLFMPLFLMGKNRSFLSSLTDDFKWADIIGIVFTFLVINMGWVFFRAENMWHAYSYFLRMFSSFSFEMPSLIGIILLIIILTVDFIMTIKRDTLIFYCILFGGILAGALTTSPSEFIYFQF